MFKEYHTSYEKQPFFTDSVKKSVNNHFVTGDIANFDQITPCFLFKKSPNKYLSSLSPSEYKILVFLSRFKKAEFIRLTNKHIAEQTGCCTRTVIRATNKFMNDGLLYKYQKCTYSVNEYSLSPAITKGAVSYHLWVNTLSLVQQNELMMSGIIPGNRIEKSLQSEDVTLNIRSSLIVSLFNIKKPVLSNLTVERVTGSQIGTGLFHKRATRGNCVAKDGMIMNGSSPNINDIELSPVQSKVVSEFKINGYDVLKLFAFDDDVLAFALSHYCEGVAIGRVNRFPWLLDICKKNQKNPDWRRFYRLCELYGIDPKKHKDYKKNKPVVRKVIKKEIVKEKKKMTVKEMQDEIVRFEGLIKNYDPKTHFLGDTLIKNWLRSIEWLKIDIKEINNHD